MSDDRVRLHVEASVVLVSSSHVFYKFCTEVYSSNIFRFFRSMSSLLKCHFKYIYEKYIQPISEKYINHLIKSILSYFKFKRSILIAHFFFVRLAWILEIWSKLL